jgi:glycosyltransferase involved in cell wall biosynthesis
MITYNHEPFIAKAIEGVLMQKTRFDIELIIGEDCSTDNTRKICIDYKERYPDLIRLQLPDKNKGMMQNFKDVLEAATGKYIALCEGDDYWTDPYKLQKQVTILESDESIKITFHSKYLLHPDNSIHIMNQFPIVKTVTYRADLFQMNYIPTLSVVYRNTKNIIDFSLAEGFWFGDYFLYLSLLKTSRDKIYYINEAMGVYRCGRKESASNSAPKIKKYEDFIKLYKYFLANEKGLSRNEIASLHSSLARARLGLISSEDYQKNLVVWSGQYLQACLSILISLVQKRKNYKLYTSYILFIKVLLKKIRNLIERPLKLSKP